MATENNKQSPRASRATLLVLLAISIGLAGPIAINVHELTHVLCAVKGECFGEVKWLEGISALPIWNLMFGTWAAVLFVLSALGHRFILPSLVQALQSTLAAQEANKLPSLAELKKAAQLCLIFSAALWLLMLLVAIWYFLSANA